jgi:hypothetical protein
MDLYIFDMDGVLLKPVGYHRALQDTVRIVGEKMGFGDVILTDEQIARFEALGIANEWHSGALCLSVMTLNRQMNEKISALQLEPLFEVLASQSLSVTPRLRGEAAVSHLAREAGLPDADALNYIENSEQIDKSLTMQVFQSMILGDGLFEQTYQMPTLHKTESYLKRFDQRLLSVENAAKLLDWSADELNGSAIMTNRPSLGPDNFLGDPDAGFGLDLVGLVPVPLIGFGEATWLADRAGKPWVEVIKPNLDHAMAAILAAAGWEVEASLRLMTQPPEEWRFDNLAHLRGSQITVFEDTPAGVIAVQAAGDLLNRFGVDVTVRKVGIATAPAKVSGLEGVGAKVFGDINLALASLNHA